MAGNIARRVAGLLRLARVVLLPAAISGMIVLPPGVCANGDEAAAFHHGDWPFRPPARPPLPATQRGDWAINAIDAFVLAELEAVDLQPGPRADKVTLLRRLTFDLIGLPPTPDDLDRFLADDSPDAYEREVDRLLASPGYGERWAQHWLDLARWAETDGFKADDLRPQAFKYRDYCIRAMNGDLPYDQFIAQQLAGDELAPSDRSAVIATGFLRLYPDEYNAANLEQRRQEILDDITGTTSLVFLGLTMGCAQCHDHKFDNIAQTDYFRLQAFFAALSPCDALPPASDADRRRREVQQAVWLEATASVRAEMDALAGAERDELRQYALGKFRAEILHAVRVPADQRTPYEQQIAAMALKQATVKEGELLAKLSAEDKSRYQSLQGILAQFDFLKPAPPESVMAAGDVGPTPPETFRLDGGQWRKPAEAVDPGFPEFLGEPDAPPCSSPGDTTGRRSALAAWLTRADHPLTARVMVNRLWQHHFGLGIVPTPNDFGAQGDPPSHPRLLDWLAVEFVDQGWRLKPMHRLMVLSATYQQSAQVGESERDRFSAQRDPQNKRLWRARRRRLEGESLRDAMLQVSGQLNGRMYGPSARPELPADLSKSYAWQPDADPADRQRRSVYVLAKRNLRYPLFDAFDLPDMHHSCARRAVTVTAPQALVLLNGELSIDCARRWAERLTEESGESSTRFIELAWRQAFGRLPENDEIATASAFLDAQAAQFAGGAVEPAAVSQARSLAAVDLCHALLNANEFLWID